MTKRILIFSLAYLPYVGGAEIAIKEITDRLSSGEARIEPSDIEFHLVTLRFDSSWAADECIGNVFVHRIGFGRKHAVIGSTFSPLFYLSKIFFIPLAAWKGATLHRQQPFDAGWAMMLYMLFPIVLMRTFGHAFPYAVTIQEGDAYERQFGRAYLKPFLPLLDYGLRRAAVVQAISHFLADWARRRGFEGPLAVVPNGVDGDAFSREIPFEEKRALREACGLGQSDCVLITISRLVAKNGVDLVIRALAALPERAAFLIVGEGPERSALAELAQELGVADRVIFAGHIGHSDLPPLLHASDLFIRASRSEGQGIAFIEAMAAGIPVVAPQVGGIADFLFDQAKNPGREPTGFAIDPESPASIAETVQKIIDDPLRAHQIATNAQRTVLREYDWDKVAREMQEKVFARITN